MNKWVLLGLLLCLTGCTLLEPSKTYEYHLSNGDVTICDYLFTSECGSVIRECVNGRDYKCQINYYRVEVVEGLECVN